jgi:hypothetical protein
MTLSSSSSPLSVPFPILYDVVVLCTKISIIKLPLAIVRIFVGYDYIEGVEPQGLRRILSSFSILNIT